MTAWFIGDVHGCIDELVELDATLPPEDKRVFVGDLVDRGPDSLGVLEYVYSRGYTVVRGNHDDKLFRYLKGNAVERAEPWWDQAMPYYQWLAEMPLSATEGGVTAIHGGLLPKHKRGLNKSVMFVRHVTPEGRMVRLGEKCEQDVYWADLYDRDPFLGPVVYGHQPVTTPKILHYSAGIDTGCVFGGKLTAFSSRGGVSYRTASVRAKRQYAEPYEL